MKELFKLWRKYASVPILISQIITNIYCSDFVCGLVVALWLTVPCTLKEVNKNWWLWYTRQILFATMAILLMLKK